MVSFALFNPKSSNVKGYYSISESKRWEKQNLFLPPASHMHCHKGVICSRETLLRPRNIFFLLVAVFILLLCFVFRKTVPSMLSSPPPNVLLLLSLTHSHSLTSWCLREPHVWEPPSCFPCFPSCLFMLHPSPGAWVPTLSTGTCALGSRGAGELGGGRQLLSFLVRSWMSWRLVPSSCVWDGLQASRHYLRGGWSKCLSLPSSGGFWVPQLVGTPES